MYENEVHDSTDNILNKSYDYYEQDVTEPLDYWSLDDFGDVLPISSIES